VLDGSKATVLAGVTRAHLSCHLLLSRREIVRLQGEGYKLTAAR
jgi:hypothetical protein